MRKLLFLLMGAVTLSSAFAQTPDIPLSPAAESGLHLAPRIGFALRAGHVCGLAESDLTGLSAHYDQLVRHAGPAFQQEMTRKFQLGVQEGERVARKWSAAECQKQMGELRQLNTQNAQLAQILARQPVGD